MEHARTSLLPPLKYTLLALLSDGTVGKKNPRRNGSGGEREREEGDLPRGGGPEEGSSLASDGVRGVQGGAGGHGAPLQGAAAEHQGRRRRAPAARLRARRLPPLPPRHGRRALPLRAGPPVPRRLPQHRARPPHRRRAAEPLRASARARLLRRVLVAAAPHAAPSPPAAAAAAASADAASPFRRRFGQGRQGSEDAPPQGPAHPLGLQCRQPGAVVVPEAAGGGDPVPAVKF